MKTAVLASVLLVAAAAGIVRFANRQAPTGPAAFTREAFPVLAGPYLGQKPPGREAVRFAPGIVSTAAFDSPPVFSPDGREAYWTRLGAGRGLFTSRLDNGRWTFPERAPFSAPGEADVVPCFFDGGRRLLFLSTRPLPDGRTPRRGFFTFWITSRDSGAWSRPAAVDSFYTGLEDFSTIADNGALYVVRSKAESGIERFPATAGGYGAGAPLVPPVRGFPTLVGPCEEYLIVSAELPGGHGARDLHILFRRPDGTWGRPINLGPRVNGPAIEALATMSPDGKYFFFASDRSGDFDVYWLEAGFIEELRKTAAP